MSIFQTRFWGAIGGALVLSIGPSLANDYRMFERTLESERVDLSSLSANGAAELLGCYFASYFQPTRKEPRFRPALQIDGSQVAVEVTNIRDEVSENEYERIRIYAQLAERGDGFSFDFQLQVNSIAVDFTGGLAAIIATPPKRSDYDGVHPDARALVNANADDGAVRADFYISRHVRCFKGMLEGQNLPEACDRRSWLDDLHGVGETSEKAEFCAGLTPIRLAALTRAGNI